MIVIRQNDVELIKTFQAVDRRVSNIALILKDSANDLTYRIVIFDDQDNWLRIFL